MIIILNSSDKFSLYDNNNRLVADNLDFCYVYENGWYRIFKNDKYTLYNNKQELIADDLDYCEVY